MKLQIRRLKLKEITETLQKLRTLTALPICNGKSRASASETRRTRRRRKRRTRRGARRSGRSGSGVRRGRNFHCYLTILFTRLVLMVMVLRMRMVRCRMVTIRLRATELWICFTCSSRRAVRRGCIRQLCSLGGITEIQETCLLGKGKRAVRVVFLMALAHLPAIKVICT